MRDPEGSFDPAAAEWIAQRVLRRPDGGPALCPCQYGLCGRCAAGECRRTDDPQYRCVNGRLIGGPQKPETWVLDRRHLVSPGRPDLQVWLAGKPCRFICPCPCTTESHAPAAEPLQLDLFPVEVMTGA